MRPPSPSLIVAVTLLCCLLSAGIAAPDEEQLGRAQGYPVGTQATWFSQEHVRVGSFTHQAEIKGLLNGYVNGLAASSSPLTLPHAAVEPAFRWQIDAAHDLRIDDYLARQRVMGLLVVKDGVVQVERYQYERGPADRFVSHSMAKSLVSLAVGLALQEGRIKSLDDRADRYATTLTGSLYGEASLRDLLRMASGVRFNESYDGSEDSDLVRFGRVAARDGLEAAARTVGERETPAGQRFSYASAETVILAAVLRAATGMSLSAYLQPRVWQAMGAETSALWRTDRTGLESASGNFNATLRDYARLGVVLANDGQRPDTGTQILPRDYLIEATDATRQPAAFRPGFATPYFGYGYQFWTFPGRPRRFAMTGVYGQLIFIDPELKLVMVQTAATAAPVPTTLAREADALWRGVIAFYGGRW